MRSLLVLLVLVQQGLAFGGFGFDIFSEDEQQLIEDEGYWKYGNGSLWPCDEVFSGTSGSFESPGYPYNYPNNVDCEWTVEARYDEVIYYDVDIIDMEQCCDYLEIRDGLDGNGTLLHRLTGNGNQSLWDEVSPSPFMHFRFVSDGSVTGRGFTFNWTTSSEECGGEIYGSEGTLTSPGYPANYPNNADCFWEITAPEGTTITIDFEYFSTETGYDYLIISDGAVNWTEDSLLANLTGYYGDSLDQVTSTSNVISVSFTSDYSYTDYGWKFNWSASGSHPPTHKPSTQPPEGKLQCYSCIGCDSIDDDTKVVSSEDYLACFVAVEIGHDHFVFRGGSPDYFEDGSCRHEADGAIVCYCTSNLCNDDEFLRQLQRFPLLEEEEEEH